jgi:hypothetical protein
MHGAELKACARGRSSRPTALRAKPTGGTRGHSSRRRLGEEFEGGTLEGRAG